MSKFALLAFLFGSSLAIADADSSNASPNTHGELLSNGAYATYIYSLESDASGMYVRTTKVKKGNTTISFNQRGWNIDEISGHAKNIYVVLGKSMLRLPDVVCGGLAAQDIQWSEDGFILVPGMGFCGTAHEQFNDAAIVGIDKNKINYLGMVNSYLNEKGQPQLGYILASYAAFDFSPYWGSHTDGITIVVALKKTKRKLIPDLKETYQSNLEADTQYSQTLDKALSESKSLNDNIPLSDCIKNNLSSDYCEFKKIILHFSLAKGTLLAYTAETVKLNDLFSKVQQSPAITKTDLDGLKNHLSHIKPGSNGFLFWRGHSDWFIRDDE